MDKGRILVHCHEGKSRSAFIVAMTLAMKWHESNMPMTIQVAEFVKSKRPCVSINRGHFVAMGLTPPN
jgi:protein-tyrosine phosphatase